MTPPLPLSQRGLRTGDSPISYFMSQAVENPGLISLAAGLVDQDSLPAEEVARAVADMAADPAAIRAALQYGTTEGLLALRDRVLRHVCEVDGVSPAELNLTADDIILTTGSQQLLYLLSEALLDPGDIVLTESPSYFVYHGILKSMGVRVLSVPMDGDGMITDALEAKLAHLDRSGELGRVKLIYTVDYFQNPSGLTLSRERREHLVELAKRFSRSHRLLILEDAAYRELRFDGPDLPSVKSFDTDNEFVATTYTFSKPCSPGLKTGYGLMPTDLAKSVSRFKGSHDFGSNNFAQHLILRLLESGDYQRHVAKLCEVYRAKRDVTLNALSQEFPEGSGVRWARPDGGIYVWLRMPGGVDTGPDGALMKASLENGVLYVPGQFGHVGDRGTSPNTEIRLCYGVVTEDEIVEGVRRLRAATDSLKLGRYLSDIHEVPVES